MNPQTDLQQEFDRIWTEIRASKPAGGQARNETSAHSVSLAEHALKLATESGSDRFLAEAWWMLAVTLNSNEQYQDAMVFYSCAVQKFEQMGEGSVAARIRIGQVAVLAHAGHYREALDAAAAGQRWFD